MPIENISQKNSINQTLAYSFSYFLENKDLLQRDLSGFEIIIGAILGSRNSPFSLDQKNKSISIPDYSREQWGNSYIIVAGKKTVLKDTINQLYQQNKELLPSLKKLGNTASLNITNEIVLAFISDIVSLMNATDVLSRKRGITTPRTITYQHVGYGFMPTKERLQTDDRKRDILHITHTSPVAESITSIDDVILLINKHPLPLLISSTEHYIKIDSTRIKTIKDLCLEEKTKSQQKHIKAIVQTCIIRRPQFFTEYTQAVEKGLPKEQCNKAFLTCFSKLYLIKKNIQLKIIDANGNILPWIGTLHKKGGEGVHNIASQIPNKAKNAPLPTMKHKIANNEENSSKIVNQTLFKTLGYSSSFSKKLYQFCCNNIMKQAREYTVQELAYYRRLQSTQDIANLYRNVATKFLILALDRILDYYLIDDKHIGRKDRTHKGHM